MKTFEQYISEARQNYIFGGIDDRNTFVYNYTPKDKDELEEIIEKLIKERGNEGDFNDIDTSEVNDMSGLFTSIYPNFNGDISKWCTNNVTDMSYMFCGATSFNQDISRWDTSNVTDMNEMFYKAKSFNGDISNWDVSKVTDMNSMFCYASSFNQDISNWETSKVTDIEDMFYNCPIEEDYKPKFNE